MSEKIGREEIDAIETIIRTSSRRIREAVEMIGIDGLRIIQNQAVEMWKDASDPGEEIIMVFAVGAIACASLKIAKE